MIQLVFSHKCHFLHYCLGTEFDQGICVVIRSVYFLQYAFTSALLLMLHFRINPPSLNLSHRVYKIKSK